MAARPTVSVFSAKGESSSSLPLPAVFTAPIRLDVVQQVHSELLFCLEGRAEGYAAGREEMKDGRIGCTQRRTDGGTEH
jgi:hypothetical protein